jgi:hypothetical protein
MCQAFELINECTSAVFGSDKELAGCFVEKLTEKIEAVMGRSLML